jgi:GntR family transcriptional regulator
LTTLHLFDKKDSNQLFSHDIKKMLNPDSPIPLYHQLASILTDKIRNGTYRPGDRIPSENRLAVKYGIGRPTVRQAMELLIRKRMLIRKRGSGTYVQSPKKEVDLLSLAGTMSSFHKKGLLTTTKILQKTRLINISKNDPENPFAGQKSFFFERLTSFEGMPVLIEDLYLHPELFKGFDEIDLSEQSLSEIVFERYYMRPTNGKQTFRIEFLPAHRAKILEIRSSTPILEVKRFLHFPQADNAIFSELYCRTDQFVFSQTIGGTTDA